MHCQTSDQAAIDARWMDVALRLARRGLGRVAPNPAVGAVIVSPDGREVGRGWTQPGGRPHAETEALARAGGAARGATLYVTLEPCSHFGKTPPCADAVIAAGISRVVAATGDPDPRVSGRGFSMLREAGIEVVLGVGEEAARRLNAGHVARVTLGRPHVTLKIAVSRDGKLALPGRRTAYITGDASRTRVHMMRAEADAIMVGIGTVLADDPELTCRLPGMADRSPVRVILDGDLRTPPTHKIALTARETQTWIVAAEEAPVEAERTLRAAGADVMRVGRGGDGRLSIPDALGLLAARGVTRLMVEGGATVAAALLRADLIDEAAVSTGPCTLGPEAIDALEGAPLTALTHSPRLRETRRFAIGEDFWAIYERA